MILTLIKTQFLLSFWKGANHWWKHLNLQVHLLPRCFIWGNFANNLLIFLFRFVLRETIYTIYKSINNDHTKLLSINLHSSIGVWALDIVTSKDKYHWFKVILISLGYIMKWNSLECSCNNKNVDHFPTELRIVKCLHYVIFCYITSPLIAHYSKRREIEISLFYLSILCAT